jgi:hypothetical protein
MAAGGANQCGRMEFSGDQKRAAGIRFPYEGRRNSNAKGQNDQADCR